MKKISIFMILLLLIASLCGCNLKADTSDATAYATQFLDCVIADDYYGAFSQVEHVCTQDEFDTLWTYMREEFGGATEYSANACAWKSNYGIGSATTTVSFEITLNNGRSGTFDVVISSDTEGIAGCTYACDPGSIG